MNDETATALVLDLLRAQPGLDVFEGEPTARMDSDGKAHPYACLYVFPGWTEAGAEAMCGDLGPRIWRFQITAAGGDLDRAKRAARRVLTALEGVRLSPMTDPIEFNVSSMFSPDRDVTPARIYTTLQFMTRLPV